MDVENAAGLRALAALRWREFSTLVAQAMQQRGLRDTGGNAPDEKRGDGGSQMLMSDGSGRWLLSCKHGMAYRIQAANIDELAAEMDLAGAGAGILLTQGRADREALAAAERLGIEVIDGRRLWLLLKPFLASATTRRIVADADAQARRHSIIAVLAALTLGLLVALLLPRLMLGERAPPPLMSEAAAAPAPPTPAADAGPADVAGHAVDETPDATTMARHQAEIARTLSTRAGISRAYWLTRTTLVIDRSGSGSSKLIWPLVCGELERYPTPLRTVRVQLNPRPDSGEAVRWRQCYTM
ncbi:restriction endonuclease [Pseudoxanthomonas broegbernensis]|uniref:restriction endonuclease n=1 Tax=Pseudoxanthomonas broegbernensis TaxID=83619 RepID=UPI0017A3BBE0|nr:restriction endonuclease [Pseudoxanthomonas broegbernensis]MBB6065018.1 hypothetical protein [Pseudoxanthomonas broegbernensis]